MFCVVSCSVALLCRSFSFTIHYLVLDVHSAVKTLNLVFQSAVQSFPSLQIEKNRKTENAMTMYKTCKIKKQILHIQPELSIQLYRYRLYCMYSVGLLLYSRV